MQSAPSGPGGAVLLGGGERSEGDSWGMPRGALLLPKNCPAVPAGSVRTVSWIRGPRLRPSGAGSPGIAVCGSVLAALLQIPLVWVLSNHTRPILKNQFQVFFLDLDLIC